MKLDLTTGTYELVKAEQSYVTEPCFCLEHVLYITKPLMPEYQYLKVWIPQAYVNEEESAINWEAEVNGYTPRSCPIIFRNNCTGWFSSNPENEVENRQGINDFMRNGYVLVVCGARSRNAVKNGINYGKAPSPLVDLKAGLRFLRANKDVLPGNTDRIFSIGGSGAGQMSAALSAAGDMKDYYPYLYALGAAGVEKTEDGKYVSSISDRVYACQAYYPITDIDNADIAYAWMRVRTGEKGFSARFPFPQDVTFTPFQLELQKDEADAFVRYLNSLGLKDSDGNILRLESLRSGSYYAAILNNISVALNAYLAELEDPSVYVDKLLATNKPGKTWVVKLNNGKLKVTDLDLFIANSGNRGDATTLGTCFLRNKDIPGFDTLALSAENNAFGRVDEPAVHYSATVAKVLKDNYEKYLSLMTEEEKAQADLWIEQALDNRFLEYQTYLVDPLEILLNRKAGKEQTVPAEHWRIRSGTADEHTSFSIGFNLALSLIANGLDTDYSLVWAMIHGDEAEGTSTGTFVGWVESLRG